MHKQFLWRPAVMAFALFTLGLSGLAKAEVTSAGTPSPANVWTAPASSAQKKNPFPADEKSVAAGKALYSSCLPCHGTTGGGDGPAAGFLNKHPGIFSDPKMWQESDGALFWKITEGNTPMPTFRDALTPEQRWHLINYLRTLAPKPTGDIAAAAIPQEKPAEVQATVSNAKIEELTAQVEDLRQDLIGVKKMSKDAYLGSTKTMIGGYGTSGFESHSSGGSAYNPSFNAAFNPVFLWKMNDQLLFEAETELQLEGTNTTLNLEMAQLSYLICDYVTLGMGRFLNPMNYFVERQHMNWVNKLVDKPLGVYDGFLPESDLGMQLRGAFALGPTKFEYSVFAIDAPQLILDDTTAFGTMEFSNLDNRNFNIATGGRFGFFPIPEFEIGYGFQTSSVDSTGKVHALMQSVDANYVQESTNLRGLIALRAQWAWSKVDAWVYQPGDVSFDNEQHGGYAQLSYRPTEVESFLKSVEPVVRVDALNNSKLPGGQVEKRLAVGLNYWLASSIVIKGDFETAHIDGVSDNDKAFLFQFIAGF